MAAATDLLERKAGLAAAIPADAATPAGKRIPADAAILAGNGIPADAATLAGNGIPADAVILAGRRFRAAESILAVAATTVGVTTTVAATTIADGAGGMVAVGALASGTTLHLTRTALAITISRTIAIPTATTISGATGIPQPLAAMPTLMRDINAAR
jgi:hypothetical protein